MVDPYDTAHPDGPDDPEDLPAGAPMVTISWVDDNDGFESEWVSDFRPHLEDPLRQATGLPVFEGWLTS